MAKPIMSLLRELRAVAEPTRLRMLAVLSRGEFSVGDLLFSSRPRSMSFGEYDGGVSRRRRGGRPGMKSP